MDEKREKRIFLYAIGIIAFTVSMIFIYFKFDSFTAILGMFISALTPFFAGVIIAFVLNSAVNLFEDIVFYPINKLCKPKGIWAKIRKPISILLAYILVLSIFTAVLFVVIPELFSSLQLFFTTASKNIPMYIDSFYKFITNLINENEWDIDINEVQNLFFKNFNISGIIDSLSQATTDFFKSLVSTTFSVASGVFTFVMSTIFSIYFLSGKDKLIKTFKKLLYSYTPRKVANRTSMFLSVSNRIFTNYVRGQLTECLILGTLCYIGMNIIGLQYSLLISTIITFFALIPVVGAFIGVAVGAILLLIVDPADALWFVIFFIILQQFEGNVIYPKVVGSSIGLPGIWTLAAVTVMGSLFGILGILIGTPTAAVVYTLIKHNTNERLKKKEVTDSVLEGSEVKVIYADIIDPEVEVKPEKKKLIKFTKKEK